MPTVEFPPVIPFTSQATGVPLEMQKLAVKVCVCPRERLTPEGETESAQEIVTEALAVFVASATLVAVIVMFGEAGIVAGAVYVAD